MLATILKQNFSNNWFRWIVLRCAVMVDASRSAANASRITRGEICCCWVVEVEDPVFWKFLFEAKYSSTSSFGGWGLPYSSTLIFGSSASWM